MCIFPARQSVQPEIDSNYFRAVGDHLRGAIVSEGQMIRTEAAQLELQFHVPAKAV